MNEINYTAFIDILGFSNYIKNSITNNYEAEEFDEKVRKELIECLEHLKNDNYKEHFKKAEHLQSISFDYLWISDTFVLRVKSNSDCKSKDNKNQLRAMQISLLAMKVSYVNFYFCNEYNLSIRGAITSKFTYLKDRLLLGEGISEAHNLESKIAVNPRVVFANDILTESIKIFSSMGKDSLISKDCDGYYFVNYLNVLKLTPPMCGKGVSRLSPSSAEEQVALTLKNHKHMIQNGLKIEKVEIFSKYLWIKEYHNRFIQENKLFSGLLI